MESLGFSLNEHSPKLWRLAWRAGIALPPPFQASFLGNFLLCAGLFPLGLGVLFALRETDMAKALTPYPGWVITGLTVAGLLTGLALAAYWRSRRIKFGLPLWHEAE